MHTTRRVSRETDTEWEDEGLLQRRYSGGSWTLWRCRLCGATAWRHLEEGTDEYLVHLDPVSAERCMDRWHRMHRKRSRRRAGGADSRCAASGGADPDAVTPGD